MMKMKGCGSYHGLF